MTLDLAYSYCSNLTKQEKLDIDKQVRKNRVKLKSLLLKYFYNRIGSLKINKDNENNVSSKIELVNKTVDFLKRTIHKTYRITQVISKCGVVQKVRISFVTFVFALGLRFGNSSPIEPIIQTQTQVERRLEHSNSTQAYQAMEGSVRNLLKISGGDLGKPSNPGTKARSNVIANRAKGPKKRGIGAEAWLQNPSKRSRPTAANRLAQQLQAGQAEGGNELFGRFSARPTPDPPNSACASGPRSITVLEGQSKNQDGQASSEKQPNTRTFEAHDGFKTELTDKSASHLTSKHGHKFGVDDSLPLSPNQKPTQYKQIRTRLNKENKAKVGKEIESILSNPESKVYPDVSIRGIQGRVYYCPDTDRVVGIHTEGEFEGQIMKAQPISDKQLKKLQKLKKID